MQTQVKEPPIAQVKDPPTTTAVAVREDGAAPARRMELTFTPEQVDLIKRTVAKGASDDELALFLYQARRMGLDPLARQIHAVKRWDRTQNREVMAIQVGIDGYRLIAERTGTYCPGRAPTFEYDKAGRLIAATAYARKLVGGQWHEISATAFYDEYVQTRKDGSPTAMWERMPRSQLAKCAEALVLRKGWPAELSGAYTDEEMQQADSLERPSAPTAAQPSAAADGLRRKPAGPPDEQPVAPGALTWGQLRRLMALIRERRLVDLEGPEAEVRTRILDYLSGAIGREIRSRAEITPEEASALIVRFERMSSPPAGPAPTPATAEADEADEWEEAPEREPGDESDETLYASPTDGR